MKYTGDSDDEALSALRRGEPQNMLVVFNADPSAPPGAPHGGAAGAKAKAFAPGGAVAKAGARVAQDYSMMAISLVTVPNMAALDALGADPNVVSISPNRRAHTMRPMGAGGMGAGGMGAGGMSVGGMSMGGIRRLPGAQTQPAGASAGAKPAAGGQGAKAPAAPQAQPKQQPPAQPKAAAKPAPPRD